jgi:hypothetical protein
MDFLEKYLIKGKARDVSFDEKSVSSTIYSRINVYQGFVIYRNSCRTKFGRVPIENSRKKSH